MTKYKIAKIDVHVQGVVFPAPKAEPAAEETEQETSAQELKDEQK